MDDQEREALLDRLVGDGRAWAVNRRKEQSKEFNKLVDDHNKVKSGLLEGFPFSTIQPANIQSNRSNKKCLNIDSEGLSVQDCTLRQSQRWKPCRRANI